MVFGLFNKEESLVAVDIGASSIKLLELDVSTEPPTLVNVGIAPLTFDGFNNNLIARVPEVAEQITSLMEANGISDKRIAIAMPGPAVFTKKIKVPKMDIAELGPHIQFEAANFIPHNVNAVRLDYHILGESGKNHLDVLVAAIKNEIIDSFLDTFGAAGLEVAVVDVDYFAVQNMFELSYPELIESSVGLVNIGARYSSINICRDGESIFTGDIPVGGKVFTDSLAEGIGVSAEEAEALKRARDKSSPYYQMLKEILEKNIEYIASELNRHLSFFWNASGAEEGIDRILISGGGALVPGLPRALTDKTGIECSLLNPFRGVDHSGDFDSEYLKEIGPQMAVAIGLGLREAGDRVIPDYL
jgi:type IV pilus assembly protein PilM